MRRKHYSGLRFASVALRIAAVLCLGVGLYGTIRLVELELAIRDYETWMRAIAFLAGVLSVSVVAILLWAMSDFIVLAIDVAESCRKTASILESRNRRIEISNAVDADNPDVR